MTISIPSSKIAPMTIAAIRPGVSNDLALGLATPVDVGCAELVMVPDVAVVDINVVPVVCSEEVVTVGIPDLDEVSGVVDTPELIDVDWDAEACVDDCDVGVPSGVVDIDKELDDTEMVELTTEVVPVVCEAVLVDEAVGGVGDELVTGGVPVEPVSLELVEEPVVLHSVAV